MTKYEDFSFLLLKSPEDGLTFVALDSVVGYIRQLSEDIIKTDVDKHSADLLSNAFGALASRLEEIDPPN
jgi:hypothetical protein